MVFVPTVCDNSVIWCRVVYKFHLIDIHYLNRNNSTSNKPKPPLPKHTNNLLPLNLFESVHDWQKYSDYVGESLRNEKIQNRIDIMSGRSISTRAILEPDIVADPSWLTKL